MMRVLQVPEVCVWNPYVELAERHLVEQGMAVLRPGLCVDGPFDVPVPPPRVDPVPEVVHLHWPEMLPEWYGVDTAIAILTDLRQRGARLVQTVHDLLPHPVPGADPRIGAYLHDVDAMTSGAHFFSPAHERQARASRPNLPPLVTYLPHPAFPRGFGGPPDPSPRVDTGSPSPAREVVLGCFGRIRPDKRFIELGHAFGELAKAGYRLLVAGAPLNDAIDRDMRQLTDAYPSITYLPGFHSHHRFAELVSEVDWVAFPYERVFSSGVMVVAIQAGRPILARQPTGAEAYRLGGGLLVVDPWDHEVAVPPRPT